MSTTSNWPDFGPILGVTPILLQFFTFLKVFPISKMASLTSLKNTDVSLWENITKLLTFYMKRKSILRFILLPYHHNTLLRQGIISNSLLHYLMFIYKFGHIMMIRKFNSLLSFESPCNIYFGGIVLFYYIELCISTINF